MEGAAFSRSSGSLAKSGFLRNSSSVAPHQLALQSRHALLFLLLLLAHDVVVLRGDQLVRLAGFRDLEPEPIQGALEERRVGVEADSGAHVARAPPPVTQVQSEGIIGVARRNPDRALESRGLRGEVSPHRRSSPPTSGRSRD